MCRARLLPARRPLRIRFLAAFGVLVTLCAVSATLAASFDPDDDDPTSWFRLEYLNLWTSHASLGAPLVTTGDTTNLGRLGYADTKPLFGPGNLPAPAFPGMKLTVGGWLYDNVLGGEFNVFATSLRATHFSDASDPSGSPLLAIPFADVTSGMAHESSLIVSQPGVASGRVWADDAMEFYGFNLDGLASLNEQIVNPSASVSLLGGLKMLSLHERFKFSSGTDFLSGPSLNHNDIFMTNDAFFGADFGVRGGYRWRRWTIEATGRTAVGFSSSTLYIAAQDSLSFALPRIRTVPGEGFFAQPSNIGWRYRQGLSVVPSAQLRVGYNLTSRLRVTIGYEAFLWTRMIRAPEQLDRAINLSQVIGPLVGPGHPAPGAHYSNFWAQGFTAGVQFSF